MLCLVSFFLLSVLCYSAYSASATFQLCHSRKPDYDSCLSKAIEGALRKFKSGSPEYGLPPLEPLKIDSLVIPSGKSAVQLEQHYKNVQTNFDLSNIKIVNAHFDPKQKTLKFTTLHPVITQTGEFSASGQLLVIPISGSGPSTTKLYKMTYHHELAFEEYTKNGDTYFKIKQYKMKGDPEKATFHFEGLLGGDKNINENINNVLNENWQDIWKDIKKPVGQAYSIINKNLASKFFERVPIKDIFPS